MISVGNSLQGRSSSSSADVFKGRRHFRSLSRRDENPRGNNNREDGGMEDSQESVFSFRNGDILKQFFISHLRDEKLLLLPEEALKHEQNIGNGCFSPHRFCVFPIVWSHLSLGPPAVQFLYLSLFPLFPAGSLCVCVLPRKIKTRLPSNLELQEFFPAYWSIKKPNYDRNKNT
ncbi:hypothetical protein CHARACLAT_031301, partial [Characodon lateralis]|nr:hypothetical protein [Characodon lateralis]